jgi:hypothetical protein
MFVFVGECPSKRACLLNITWESGGLAGKQLKDALTSIGFNYNEQIFLNLWRTSSNVPVDPQAVQKLEQYYQEGYCIVGMGKRVQKELDKLGVQHLKLIHPAARGSIRQKACYTAHLKLILLG